MQKFTLLFTILLIFPIFCINLIPDYDYTISINFPNPDSQKSQNYDHNNRVFFHMKIQRLQFLSKLHKKLKI